MHHPEGCRWPLWPDDERPPHPPLFCDEARVIGRSYCRHHLAVAYLPPGQVQAPDPRSLDRPRSSAFRCAA